MKYYEVWQGDLYYGIYNEDELWMFEGEHWMQFIDISA